MFTKKGTATTRRMRKEKTRGKTTTRTQAPRTLGDLSGLGRIRSRLRIGECSRAEPHDIRNLSKPLPKFLLVERHVFDYMSSLCLPMNLPHNIIYSYISAMVPPSPKESFSSESSPSLEPFAPCPYRFATSGDGMEDHFPIFSTAVYCSTVSCEDTDDGLGLCINLLVDSANGRLPLDICRETSVRGIGRCLRIIREFRISGRRHFKRGGLLPSAAMFFLAAAICFNHSTESRAF